MRGLGHFLRSMLGHAPDAGSSPTDASSLPGGLKRIVEAKGFRVELDLASQMLALEAPPDDESDERRAGEAVLAATLGQLDLEGPVSAAVLAQKAKIFDDGLYAAVEVAAQEGAGSHAGKATLLASLSRALAKTGFDMAGDAGAVLLGAARLGEVALPDLPAPVEALVQHVTQAFLARELHSKPIAFYTWSGRLASIFQQDRMLQTPLRSVAPDAPRECEDIAALVDALHGDPSARVIYERHLRLVSRLTNPYAAPDLRYLLEARDRGAAQEPMPGTAFFPASAAHETEIVKKMFGDAPIPDGFVLADEMINRIRSGELDLAPRPVSGWYDYQTWALEPLVVPERMAEAARLELGTEYRKLLLELFKGLLTLTRETHIKQLEVPLCGMGMGAWEPPIVIAPVLSTEPLATFYLRRALGYRFLRGVLEDAFGARALERMKRLTAEGPRSQSLAEDLADIEQLFVGAHVTVTRQLGMAPDDAVGDARFAGEAANRFEAWSREQDRDPELGQDVRAMVPVFYDVGRGKTKVWVFLGWSQRPVVVSFARPPQATVVNRLGRPVVKHPPIVWGSLYARLAYPVMAELYVDRILNRAEFRQLCDECRTRTEILRRLGVAASPADLGSMTPERDRTRLCPQCGWQPLRIAGGIPPSVCARCGAVLLVNEP